MMNTNNRDRQGVVVILSAAKDLRAGAANRLGTGDPSLRSG